MPRKKLSEYRAKTIVTAALGLKYVGYPIDAEAPLQSQLKATTGDKFAVKVDQGVKGRYKKGLVLLNVVERELSHAVRQLAAQGYRWLLIEPMLAHDTSDEHYLSLAQNRQGLLLNFSRVGGVDIEAHSDTLRSQYLTAETDWKVLAAATSFSEAQLQALVEAFEREYMTFLEINPYVLMHEGLCLLDLAIEVDDAGTYFVQGWQESDFRRAASRSVTHQERTVSRLDEKSPASLKLELINPDGSIFMLLSGGGASIVAADEVYNHGYGKRLANYGEYSGNPTTEETYIYTTAVIELLLASKARKKVLFIGGAVANFTDIANTFTGIIQAINKFADQLRHQHVKIYVRRGGPRQEVGLANMQEALKKHELLGAVHGPTQTLPDAITEMLEGVA